MIDKVHLNAQLLARIRELCEYLFPNGRRSGRSWRLGSLDINLRSGFWGDWDGSTTSMSRNLIDLWLYAQHVDFVTGVNQIQEWLGGSSMRAIPYIVRKSDAERKLELPVLAEPSRSELRRLAELRQLPIQGLFIAVSRGFLWTYWDPFERTRCWLITDTPRKSAVARRLDGTPWEANGAEELKARLCEALGDRGR
jgi:hypothetical protein